MQLKEIIHHSCMCCSRHCLYSEIYRNDIRYYYYAGAGQEGGGAVHHCNQSRLDYRRLSSISEFEPGRSGESALFASGITAAYNPPKLKMKTNISRPADSYDL